jgi:hypothetical protein
LSIIGFNSRKVISANKKVLEFYNSIQDKECLQSLHCCREKVTCTDEAHTCVQETDDPSDLHLSESDFQQLDDLCKSHFTSGDSENTEFVDLEEILHRILTQATVDTSPAEDISPHTLLEQLMDTSVKGTEIGSLGEKLNSLIDSLQKEDHLPKG